MNKFTQNDVIRAFLYTVLMMYFNVVTFGATSFVELSLCFVFDSVAAFVVMDIFKWLYNWEYNMGR